MFLSEQTFTKLFLPLASVLLKNRMVVYKVKDQLPNTGWTHHINLILKNILKKKQHVLPLTLFFPDAENESQNC